MKSFALILLLAIALLTAASPVFAQAPSASPAPTAYPTPSIAADTDPATATRAWLNTVPAADKTRSDSYFEGKYWLILWNFLVDIAVALLLLNSRISARLRDFAERTTRFKAMQVAIYAIVYSLLTVLLSAPLGIYENFFREHQYGLATQTFGPWLTEQLIAIVLSTFATALLLIAVYAIFRRAPRTYWLWAALIVTAFITFVILIAPIYIEPLFNKYKPLSDQKISESILTMARANQIPVKQVFEVDASRQSNRVSANVAGFLGTTRIALNDNLLKQCTLPEIRAVMAHEMGHYILNHVSKFLITFALVALIGFAVAKALFEAAVRRWGERWGVRGIADPAGLPLLAAIFAALSFLLTPVKNTMVRVNEIEADAFGVNTAREPDGFAMVALKLGKYRKLDPTPLEEFIFFDHPSGRARIRMAMDWKAAHLPAGSE